MGIDVVAAGYRWSDATRCSLEMPMRSLLILLLATAATLAGCGGEAESEVQDATPASPSAAPSTALPSAPTGTPDVTHTETPRERVQPRSSRTSEAAREGTVVTTARSDFGTMLFDSTGQAIYLFDSEATSRPECYGQCAEAWPPVLTHGKPIADGAVRTDLLGTTRRADGSTQITYAGHPLYYYVHDGRDEVLCHNVTEFGGLWLVVTPGGAPAAT